MLDWLKATGCVFALFLGVFALAAAAQAGPEDGRIVNGSGSISQSGTHTDIHQNSDFLATHWGSFNIAAHESVQAHQPGASSRLLIRVDGGGTGTGGGTNIAGSYTSNGITILENQNGVQFSRGAIVNVGGLLATSSRISGVSGANWQLNGTGGAVVNHGQIAAGAGGVVLAAVRVENHGKITAQGGDVALGAGSSFTVDFAGSMVGFEVSQAASGASLANTGKIEAQGGVVSLSAQEAQAVRTNVVSVGGVVKATRIERRGGVVYLSGGTQGIAEVSGDVSASDKVQTTGEYVVVKEGALLKAPEILVGGDFQGGGDVQTAQRTLVERGALLDAGAEGRVIVWSDDVTWFNGDISAPEGFAEVSGKQTLASVHLAGIDVGELLLDPADIIIAATGTAVSGDIAAADAPPAVTLGVADINSFTDALSLAATNRIMVTVAITKTTGNLTLTAGGVLTLGANITTSAGDLALTGASIELGGTITLTGGAITLTGAIGGTNNTFSAAASGVLTLNSNINTGTSDLTLAGGMGGIALGGDLLLNGGNVIITGAIAEAATSTDDLNIVALDDMTLNSDINLGMGTLTLRAGITSTTGDIGNGGTARQIMAGSLHLRTAAILSATLFTTTSRVGGAVEIRFGTAISPTFPADNWLFSLGQGDLSIRGIDGVTLGTLAVGTISSTGGVVDLRATTITLGVAITGTAITLYADALTGSAVSLTATDGDIDLRTANGTANSAPSGSTFTSVTLRQNSAFGATAPLIFPATVTSLTLTTAAPQTLQGWMVGATALNRTLSITTDGVLFITRSDINIGTGDLTLSASSIVLGSMGAAATTFTARDITLDGLIDSSAIPRDLTLTASARIFLRSDINTGTGNITLNAVNFITVEADADVRLTGGNVMLTSSGGGLITVNPSNFITLGVFANGDITLNINRTIDIRGRFELNAGGSIINSGTVGALRAEDVFLQQAGAFADNLFATTGNDVSGSVSLRITAPNITQEIHPWMAGLGNGDFSLAGEGVVLNRITILAAFTRSAGEVDLRATSILFDAPLTGTSVILRTNGVQSSDALVAIHATAGDITATRINGDGTAGTGLPSLFSVNSFTLEQTSAFGGLNTLPFAFAAADITGAITLVTRSAQTVQTWMVADGRSLSITSTGGDITISRNVNVVGGDLTFAATGANNIVLGASLALTGRDISLTGAIDESSSGNDGLTVTASGVLTLNSGINTGTGNMTLTGGTGGTGGITLGGDVELRGGVIRLSSAVDGRTGNHALSILADGNIFLGGVITLGSGALQLIADQDNNRSGNISNPGGTAIMVGALTLRQVASFGDTLFASGSTASGAVVLRLRTAVDQPVHPWMAGLGNGAFSLRGVDGITLTSIITTTALNQSTGSVDLQATAISLGGNVTGRDGITLIADTITLTANIDLSSNASVSLTGAIDGSANNRDLSATAAVRLTLNSNINLGTGNLSLLGVGIFVLGGNITITSGEVVISNAIQSAAGVNPNFTVNASNSISIRSVNLGTGNLTLNNMGATDIAMSLAASWNARNITLTGAIDDSANNRNLTINASGVLTLNNDINLGERNLNINAMGGITLGGNVTLTSRVTILRGAVDGTNGNHNFTIMDSAGSNLHNDINLGSGTFTLANTGSGQVNFSIVGAVGAPLTIAAGNINFMRNNDVVWVLQAGVVAQGADLTLRATGDITFQGTVINLGPGRLEMSADNEGNGTGTIIAANTPQILVGSLVLRHAATFPADFMADTSAVTGEADLRFTRAVTQAIHPWMNLGGTSFTLRGDEGEGMRAAVVLTAITLAGAANFGTTDIDLQAAAITLSADVVLTGGAISLTGALTTATNNLTITASGLLTLNSGIDLGTGILTITADDRINVPNSGTAITAGTISIEFTDRLVQSNEVGFTPAGGTSTFGNAIFEPPFTPTEMPTFAPSPCLADPCSFGDGTTEDLIVDSLLEAMTSITIDIGTGALTFGGEGAITITSAAISITAGSIDIGTRSLTIMAAGAGGTITLVGVTSITGTGAASLSLDATTIAGLSTALTLDVPSISISRDVAFGTSEPFTFGMAVTSLTIEVAAAQTVQGWMVASGRSLDITTSNVLTVDTAITGFILGDSADLTLNGMGGITLTGSGAISLTARDITLSSAGNITFNQNLTLTTEDITLNGAIDGTNGNDDDSDDRNFTVTASGGITLRSDINLGTGDLSITSTFSGGPSPIVISREGGTETAPALVTLSGGNVTLANTSAGGISGPIAGGVGLIVNALDNIILNTAIDGISALTLRADESNSGTGTITNDGTARRIQVGALFLQQAGAFGETSLFASNSSASGDVTLLISRPFNQTIHPWMVGLGGTSFTLRGAGRRRLDTITLPTALTYTGTIELHATTIALGGDLTAGAVILRTNTITRDSTDLVITATTGEITATRIDPSGDAVAGAPTLDSTVTALTLIAQSAFGSSAPFAFGTTLTSLTLQTAAPQTAYSWMGVSGSNVSLTSTGGDITIGGAIDVGTDNDLTFIASGNIVSGTPRPTLTADTVNLELTGADSAFTTTRPFLAASQITTLTITTAAAQDYRVWMRATNRNLTIDSQGAITIGSTAINLGTGNLTLMSNLEILLTNLAGLTITAGDVTFFGLSLSDDRMGVSRLVVEASGDIEITSIVLSAGRIELRADNGSIRAHPDLPVPVILADVLSMRQMGMFADNFITSRTSFIRELILRTATAVDQPIHSWMRGVVRNPDGTRDGTRFSLAGAGGVALDSITTEAAADFGTGTVELHATTINLGGALTGGVVALRTNMLTGDSADLVAIHAMTGDITSTAITSTGGADEGRPALAAGVTGFSLTRSRTFGGRGSLPFILTDLSAITAITLSTRSPQIVLSWMINPGRNLTITSASTVRVNAAIGSDVPGRSFGDGNFSLTSTGGLVRILVGISTNGNLTLIGGTAGINLNSGVRAKTLSGRNVTLSGNARSNRDLTLTATSGALTLNGDITGTRALELSGSGGIALGGALTLTGGRITLNNVVTGAANLTINVSSTLTLNRDITLTGAVLTLALSGAGVIGDGSSAARLTASTVRLRQVDVFGGSQPFSFGAATGSLELTTDAAQDVLDWMIELDRNLTVTSAGNVRVAAAIGSGVLNRNLGAGSLAGSLTLTSTGGLVRILENISTTGNITLDGATGINFNNREAKTLSGATVTLIGDARSNRELTITASTVRVRQAAVFDAAGPLFMFGTAPGSLELTTDAAQVVHNWMIADGRNLTVTSALNVIVRSAIVASGGGARDLGNGNLSLTSTGGLVRIFAGISTAGNITLNGATGINLNGRAAKTLSGAGITLTGTAQSNRALAITASGILSLSNDIRATGSTSDLSLTGSRILIRRRGSDTRILLRSDNNITLTSTLAILIGRLNGRGTFFTNGIVANLAVTATGALTIAADITVASTAASGGDIELTGGSIAFGDAARTITGTAITLSGAATGTADLTLTASGTLTINNNIGIGTNALTLTSGAGVIDNGGNIGRNRLTLTAGTVSLEQDAAFVGARPFNFSTTTDLLITTDAAQDVLDWMIVANRNLTVTSAGIVLVEAAIGSGESGRNLGNGNLTLESTGGAVRILADISTMGDLTLNGGTNGINLRGGARILNGAIVTLTGVARSNRDLTLTATTFALGDDMSTINVVGANVLTINAGSSLPASLTGNDRLTAGTLTLSFPCPDATCVDTTP